MPETMPGFVHLTCPRCDGGGEVYEEGVTLLASMLTGEPMRADRVVGCPRCRGRGWDRTVWVGEPALPIQVAASE